MSSRRLEAEKDTCFGQLDDWQVKKLPQSFDAAAAFIIIGFGIGIVGGVESSRKPLFNSQNHARMDKSKPTAAAENRPDEQLHQALEPIRQSVLVVDDEENFLTLLKWFLSQHGYDVYTASSVDEALNLVQERAFDIALLDIKLGSGDGLCLLEQVTKYSPGLKVIMMTAYPTVGSLKQAFASGALRYLTKPVDLQELAQALKLLP